MFCEQPEGAALFVPAGFGHAVLNTGEPGDVVAGVAVEIMDMATGEAGRRWSEALRGTSRYVAEAANLHGLGAGRIVHRDPRSAYLIPVQ